MKKLSILVLLICAILFMVLPATATQLQSYNSAFTIGSKSSRSMNIQFTLPDYKITEESVNGTVYHKLQVKDAGYFLDSGVPELPYMSTMIAIPNHGQVTVDVLNAHEKVVNSIMPYPVQDGAYTGNARGFEINQAVYNSGQVFPRETIVFSDPAILRDFRVITVQIQPFAWDSASNQLIIKDQVEFRLNFNDEPGINEINEPFHLSASFDKIYRSLILNYDDFRTDASLLAKTPPRMVIIYGAYTNETFQNRLNNFALWKKQKGADVRVLSTAVTGSSNANIKAYIQNLYNDINSRPDYIVIVGDITGTFAVPSWNTSGYGDYPYQHLAGTDLLGDCFIGRISAENTDQLEIILSKIYSYEKNINMATADYLNRMLIVGDTAHDGISVVYLGHYVQELSYAYNPDYTYTMLLVNGPSVATMNQAISQGVGFFQYRGYIGMSGWSPTSSLTNINKLCHGVIVTCATGNFDGTGTTETFIRLGTAAAPTGAVTAIGMYSAGTHTMPNNCLSGAIFDGIYAREMRTMGEALLNSKLYMSAIYQNTQASMVQSFTQWCNLMGDPTMEVYIGTPKTFATDAPDTLALGTPNLDLDVVDSEGEPVENACVTISQGGIILARAYTNASGFAYLPFNGGLAEGQATITVSKHDFKPLVKPVYVDTLGSLVAGTSQYDDDSVGNSIGNGNFAPNSGERLEVLFSVKNTTPNMITNVSGYVTSDDPYVTVIDSLLTFGNINVNATVFNFAPVLVDISPLCPYYTYTRLMLHLTDSNDNHYTVPVDIVVTDALLRYVSHQVSDTNNQALDPNETATLSLTIVNNGSININDVAGQLYTQNDLVAIEDDAAFFGNVNVGAQANCSANNFVIRGRENILPGMIIPMRVKLTNPTGFTKWIDFNLTIGTVTVTSPFGPDGYGYVIYDDGDTSYPECPVYQWVGIAPAEGGSGTALTLSDASTGTEGDALGAVSLATVTLPFSFQFYGLDYTQITVCTNGFISMGVTEDAAFRNYHLPGAMGPGAMIAPFWDDLATATGSGVFTWYDQANHRYIIEWYQMRNGYQTSSNETFEVILYDPAFYPTSFGDGPIKIQYHTFNNVDSGTGMQEHGVYSTIGIQDRYHHNGLEYSFNNQYPTAARPLSNGRCFYITNVPVYYALPDLAIGLNQIVDVNGNNVVEPGENVQMNVQLVNSGEGNADEVFASLSTTDPFVQITGADVQYPVIPNEGSAYNTTPFSFSVSPQCPGNHEINFVLNVVDGSYTDQLNFTVTVEKPEITLAGFYLNDLNANNNGLADPNEDFLLILNLTNQSPADAANISGTLSTTQTNVNISNATQAVTSLHLDKKVQLVFPIHFGALAVGTSVPFSFSYTADNAVPGTIPVNITCGSGTPNRSGIIHGTVSLSNLTEPTDVLLTTDNDFFTHPAPDGSYAFYFPTGTYTLAAQLQFYYTEPIPAVTLTDANLNQTVNINMAFLANPTSLVITGIMGETTAQLNWIAPANVPYPVQNYKVFRKFNDGEYSVIATPATTNYTDDLQQEEFGTYTYYVTAVYSMGEGAAGNEATIAYPFVHNGEEPVPVFVNALYANYPNPFNPTTSLTYSLAKAGEVSLCIYNTKGQLIRTLVNSNKAAGMHRITWNGDDNGGKQVSSGIYLYKVKTGNFTDTRKMMLMK